MKRIDTCCSSNELGEGVRKKAGLVDRCGRRIDYLRISITDHCNLNCLYCTPFGGRTRLAHSEVLSYEEILRVVEAAVLAGISKVRITGGEPLLRREVVELCRMLANLESLETLTVTTNGVLLQDLALPLLRAGIRRINVSLDTLRPETYRQITGHNLLSRVLSGIKKAEEVGLYPVKINTVVLRGINEDEIEDLARFTLSRPYHVRFVELMPTKGWAFGGRGLRFVPVEEILKKVRKVGEPSLEPATDTFGPARYYTLPGAVGKVGFIAPLSWHFCRSCNRLRLTADGKLRTCLFSREEIDIKGRLRAGASKRALADIFRLAVARKPLGHNLEEADGQEGVRPAMRMIGG